jgi:diadenylate cyclase
LFVILVVIFQADIRRALTRVGAQSFFGRNVAAITAADEIATAVAWLSARKIGALIVIEQDDGLAEFVETGRYLDAKVSPELLETIFMNGSPLHDGAVIVNGDTVLAAGCLLPLSQNPSVGLSLGTRHRAAIGMSEDSDAVVLVVSEEEGTISLARDGVLTRGVEPSGVLSALRKLPG